MDFSYALVALKVGKKAKRLGWNGRDMYLEMQRPEKHSKMTLPYIYICTSGTDLVPWAPSQTDLMSEDWEIVS